MFKKAILLLDAGGTQTLPIAEYFYKSNFHLSFFLHRKYTYGSGTKYSHKKVFAPDSKDEKNYLSYLLSYISEEKIDLIIPLSDITAELVSKYQDEIKIYSKIVTPAFSSFSTGYNKGLLMKLCEENNFPHPKTYHVNEKSDIEKVSKDLLPLFLKPNITTGGRGMTLIHSKSELKEKAPTILKDFGSFHLQEFIPSGGNQYKVQLFRSKDEEIIGSSVMHKIRFYPVEGGSSCYNKTIERNDLVYLCANVLDKLNWIGFADFDLIEDTQSGIVKILEINPRLPACIKSAFKSGMNYAEMYAFEAFEIKHQNYAYKTGVGLRHLGLDFLWLFKSNEMPLRKRLEWFNYFSSNQFCQDFNIKDMKSFFYGLYGNIRGQNVGQTDKPSIESKIDAS